MDFVKRQTIGPAACTVNGKKVHINLLEESWLAPFLRIGCSLGGLFLSSFLFFPPFLPLFFPPFPPPSLPSSSPSFPLSLPSCGHLVIFDFDPTSQWVEGPGASALPVGFILPSKVQGLGRVLQIINKCRLTLAVPSWLSSGQNVALHLNSSFAHADAWTK